MPCGLPTLLLLLLAHGLECGNYFICLCANCPAGRKMIAVKPPCLSLELIFLPPLLTRSPAAALAQSSINGSFFFYGPTITLFDPSLPQYPNATVISETALAPARFFAYDSVVNISLVATTVQSQSDGGLLITIAPAEFAMLQAQIDVTYTGTFGLLQYGTGGTIVKLSYFCSLHFILILAHPQQTLRPMTAAFVVC